MSKSPKNSTGLFNELKLAIGCEPSGNAVILKYHLVQHTSQNMHLTLDLKSFHHVFCTGYVNDI